MTPDSIREATRVFGAVIGNPGNWDALRAFTRDPGSQAITTLLNRVPSVKDAKAVQALMLLLLASPVELVAREYARAGFLSLPVGDGVSLDDLVELINSPQPVVLDMDSTEIPVYGQQENRAPTTVTSSPPAIIRCRCAWARR